VQVAGSGITHIEWVEVFFDSEHSYAGDLQITLRNVANGTESVLARPHQCSGNCAPYAGWRFGTGHHLDEAADGEWSLKAVDAGPQDTGRIRSWRLVFHGY
jgi:subtilisin-like proprotein convertase family protein